MSIRWAYLRHGCLVSLAAWPDGHRTPQVTTIPAAQAGTDRPIEIIDETWTSIDLKVALQTLHRDPRSGDVEYTLTKISRQEPDAALFKVPAGYEIRRPAGQR